MSLGSALKSPQCASCKINGRQKALSKKHGDTLKLYEKIFIEMGWLLVGKHYIRLGCSTSIVTWDVIFCDL